MSAMTPQSPPGERVPILWMDDKPAFIAQYATILKKEGLQIQIDTAATIGEAEKGLEGERYCAFIADCQMDDVDRAAHNGAALLLRVNRTYRCLPTFVFSAFLDDPLYAHPLEESNVLYKKDKNSDVALPLSRCPLVSRVYRYAKRFCDVRAFAPERIRFNDYIKNPAAYTRETDAHWPKHEIWVERELDRRGLVWGVVCGMDIVDGAADLSTYPDDDTLSGLGSRYNLIPFAYTRTLRPEEDTVVEDIWNPTAQRGDPYPSMRVRVSGQDLVEDFDTGASQTHVCEELAPRGIFDFLRDAQSEHLASAYRFYAKRVKLEVVAEDGTSKQAQLVVSVVRVWNTSPFAKVNPKRKMLVGRDVLRAINMEVKLDSRQCCTRVRFL